MIKERSFVLLVIMVLVLFLSVGCSSKVVSEDLPIQSSDPPQMEVEETSVPQREEYSTVELAQYVGERTVTVNADSKVGSGFFIDSEGTLVTNYHVIEGAKQIVIDVHDGSNQVSTIVDFSKVYDLAILKIDMADTPYLELCKEVKTGEPVYAVGSSLGVLEGSFTSGIVSSTKRMLGKIECIQMDAAISDGNSGGPLVNTYGEVVGVNAFSFSNGQNTNLAIKVAMLDNLTQKRNLSPSGYQEWYNKETSRSYSPFDSDLDFYYSTINRYETITGQKCLYSVKEGKKRETGYVDMSLYYGYTYVVSELDEYTEYLNSIGFEYNASASSENEYLYYSEIDRVYILCDVDTQNEIIEIMPMKPSVMEALLNDD